MARGLKPPPRLRRGRRRAGGAGAGAAGAGVAAKAAKAAEAADEERGSVATSDGQQQRAPVARRIQEPDPYFDPKG
jgi:hypothetical protein